MQDPEKPAPGHAPASNAPPENRQTEVGVNAPPTDTITPDEQALLQPQQVEKALLGLIEGYKHEQCRAIMQQAGDKARQMINSGRRQFNDQVRAAIAEQREYIKLEVRRYTSQLATRQRQLQQQNDAQWLQQAWTLLLGQLRHLWHEKTSRQQWLQSALTQARERLPGGGWIVGHPPDFDMEEIYQLMPELRQSAGCCVIDTMDAGIRISSGGACVDAGLSGLTMDHTALQGRLLDLING